MILEAVTYVMKGSNTGFCVESTCTLQWWWIIKRKSRKLGTLAWHTTVCHFGCCWNNNVCCVGKQCHMPSLTDNLQQQVPHPLSQTFTKGERHFAFCSQTGLCLFPWVDASCTVGSANVTSSLMRLSHPLSIKLPNISFVTLAWDKFQLPEDPPFWVQRVKGTSSSPAMHAWCSNPLLLSCPAGVSPLHWPSSTRVPREQDRCCGDYKPHHCAVQECVPHHAPWVSLIPAMPPALHLLTCFSSRIITKLTFEPKSLQEEVEQLRKSLLTSMEQLC